MVIERLQNILINDITYYLALFGLGISILFAILRLTADKEYVQALIDKKNKKSKLINFVSDDLNLLQNMLEVLLRDMNVVKIYNILHAKKLSKQVNKIRNIYKYLGHLDNERLQQQITEYIERCEKISVEIVELEESAYSVRRKHQEIIDILNERHKLCHLNEKEYLLNMNQANDYIKALMKSHNDARIVMYENLRQLISDAEIINHNLEYYKKKYVEHKKFHIRYVSFI